MTNEDEEIYNNSNICHMQRRIKHKVRDHCHITCKFRGVSHNKFNLNLRL